VTEPSSNPKTGTVWRILTLDFGWLRRPVSLRVILIVLAGLGVAVGMFVVAGGVDVSADRPDGWLAEHLLHFVFKRSVASGAARVNPPDDFATPSRARLAAQRFDMVCANCHGRPGFGQSVAALSMSPRPQYLPRVVGQFTNSELYVIVEHGVKYSAMPSWPTDARGDEVWSMVAFLRLLPKLDAKAYREITALPAAGAPSAAGSSDDPILRPANAQRNTTPRDEFLYAAPASGFSDQTIHDDPAATCARCHGADGSGAVTGGEAPNLTIQNAAYLRAALESYIAGGRKSGFMQDIAAQLSGPQVAALSAHYASLPVKTIASRAAPALVARGETIASEGIRERAMPACSDCHESVGSAISGAPHIAGQSATYLARQLRAMRQGGRGATLWWNPMSAVAHDLGDRDIAAAAAYYSGLTPAKATGAETLAPSPRETLPRSNMAVAKDLFATSCMKCHVNGGRGDLEGNYPNLTMQTRGYAAQSLYEFRTHDRPSNKMQEVTGALTFDQMTSLADYIDGLAPRPALARPDAAAALRGAAIATKGIPSRGVYGCLGCHGAKGVAALPLIPALQGQNAAYLLRRLDNFAKLYDVDRSALNPMPMIAGRLTHQERADLAAYFAAAPPLQKPTLRP
jgi:cytochrome c553